MADTHLSSLDLESTLKMGGTEVLNTNVSSLAKVAKVALGVATGNAGLLEWANPEDGAIIVLGLSVDITTAASGTPTADFGVATSDTGISDDTLMDAATIASIGLVNSEKHAGTNGAGKIKVPAGQYVTGTASTDPLSIVGFVYIEYIPA